MRVDHHHAPVWVVPVDSTAPLPVPPGVGIVAQADEAQELRVVGDGGKVERTGDPNGLVDFGQGDRKPPGEPIGVVRGEARPFEVGV